MAVHVAANEVFTPTTARGLADDHGAKHLFITPHGEDQLEQNPLPLHVFLDSARYFASGGEISTQNFRYIGAGVRGQVYELPGFEQLCFKVVTSRTVRALKRHTEYTGRLPSLIPEARLMHGVQQRLEERPEYRVRAPKQYAAAKFTGGYALLQEKIPEEFKPAGTVFYDKENAGTDNGELIAYGKTMAKKIKEALGPTVLRASIGDIRGKYGQLNGGNVFVNDFEEPLNGDMYVIDLLGRSHLRQLAARAMSR